jgi:predicted MPP superfamily phosphohydrolase
VARVRDAEPDLILLAGDFVTGGVPGGRYTPPQEIAARLAKLSAPLGVWAVLGNRDWQIDGPGVRAALVAVGIPVMENAATELRRESCTFWLVGLGDISNYLKREIDRTFAGMPTGAPALAFTHNPYAFRRVPAWVSLTIAGHTHGGQVFIPGVGRPMVPSDYGESYPIGHIVDDGRHLFVSPGLGTSIFPVRFLVPPEVSIIELRSASI